MDKPVCALCVPAVDPFSQQTWKSQIKSSIGPPNRALPVREKLRRITRAPIAWNRKVRQATFARMTESVCYSRSSVMPTKPSVGLIAVTKRFERHQLDTEIELLDGVR